jgi:hypothetical protein
MKSGDPRFSSKINKSNTISQFWVFKQQQFKNHVTKIKAFDFCSSP